MLKAMSASPGDTRPVFDLITRRASELCNGVVVGCSSPRATLSVCARRPPSSTYRALGVLWHSSPCGQHAHPSDVGPFSNSKSFTFAMPTLNPTCSRPYANGAHDRYCSLPLLRDGVPIGAIALNAGAWRITDSQVALLQTFAEQAVIAIGSAETYRELQARTAALAERNSEYGERIEQQAATIDVLKAMSASPGDPQPVFDLIVRRARELCNSATAAMALSTATCFHLWSTYGTSASLAPRDPRQRFPAADARITPAEQF